MLSWDEFDKEDAGDAIAAAAKPAAKKPTAKEILEE